MGSCPTTSPFAKPPWLTAHTGRHKMW
jgi:hypothetical protein